MYNKPFDVGLLVGRFNVFHNGHESLADMALKMCDRLLILVGSAQESGTIRNPFDVNTRIDMIREIYPDSNVIIKPLADLTTEDDVTPEWGKYVLKNVNQYIYKKPEIMIYGNDESRSRWFDSEDIKDTTEIIIPRSRIPVSATQLREALLKNDKDLWFKYHNPKLHKHFDMLKGRLLAIEPYNRAFSNLINQNKKLKAWSDFDVRENILEGQIDFE